MTNKIAILEDNAERREAMHRCLQDRFYQFEIAFFEAPSEMIPYLTTHWHDMAVIGLDHDIELKLTPDGRALDLGTGRDVAEFLAQRAPICPVVIHTTNSAAAIGMEMLLGEAKWKTYRVVPYDDLAWIPEWFRVTRRAVVGPVPKPKEPRTA
jgi:CheY-like chemotaxis protein